MVRLKFCVFKKKMLYFVLWMFFQLCAGYNSNSNVDEYLKKNLLHIDGHDILKRSAIIETTFSDRYIHDSNSHNIHFFSFFNTTYFLTENKIFFSVFNETFNFKFYQEFPTVENIIFLRAKQYNNLGLLFVCFQNGVTKIYKFVPNETITEIQTILTVNTSDASFFINSGNLYLVITNTKDDNVPQTSVFKWSETYFDEIQTLYTLGAKNITTFSMKKSEIIIILQQLPHDKTNLLTLEFKYDKLKKIQQFQVEHPDQITTFLKNGKNYVIISEISKRNLIYEWNGDHLSYSSEFESQNVLGKTSIVYNNDYPLILAAQKETLLIYVPHSERIKLEETKEYLSNYSVILDVNNGGNENGNITFIVGLSEDNIININAMTFKVHPAMENEQEHEALRNCFNNLEQKISNEQRHISKTLLALEQIRETDFNDILLKSSPETILLENRINTIKLRTKNLKNTLNSYSITGNNLTIEEKKIITGGIFAEELTANDVEIKNLNGNKFTPEQWLRYKANQTISGLVSFKNMSSKTLVIENENKIFEGLLTKNGNHILTGKVTVDNLTVESITTDKINEIKFDDIYLRSEPKIINGLKTFTNLTVTNLNATTLNGKSPDEIFKSPNAAQNFKSHVFIKDLWVDYIDGVKWDTFRKAIYLINENEFIEGNLRFSEIRTVHLNVKNISGIDAGNLLTTTTDQEIETNLEFNDIYAKNIITDKINNISLKTSAALINETIKGPVKIGKLEVFEDLEMTGKTDKALFLHNGDHIFGTNESDMTQRYTGTVKIKGDLYLTNLDLWPNSKLFISENQFDPNDLENYWTKSTEQNISVIVEATKGLSTPDLFVNSLNDISMDRYILTNQSFIPNTSFYFENVTVLGNVILNKNQHNSPDLEKLDENSVKTTGSFQITGSKIYASQLTVANVSTEKLGDANLSDVLTTNCSLNVTGLKIFESLTIENDLLSNLKSVKTINGLNLKKLKENVTYLDNPQNIDKLFFRKIKASDLYVKKLNGHNFAEYIEIFDKINRTKEIGNVHIDGNVTIHNVENVTRINDIVVDKILRDIEENSQGADVVGDVTFLGKVTIDDLEAYDINDIDLPALTTRLLYRKTSQTVTVPYVFKTLIAENIFTEKINNVNVSRLVDISSNTPQEIFAASGIKLEKSLITGSVLADKVIPCDIKKAVEQLKNPHAQIWSKLEINGNISILDDENSLSRLFKKSIRLDKENIILSPVVFTNHVSAENITSKKHLNKIDIEHIIKDAVLANSEEPQVITGHKTFLQINTLRAVVNGNTDAPVINDVNIRELYENIVKKNKVNNITVTGKKVFYAGLQTERFNSNTDTDFSPENIVSLENLRKIPSAIIDSLTIEHDLNINKINGMDVDYILSNRLLTEGPEVQFTNATYFFNDLEIKENANISSINKINMEDVIFDIGQQKIRGPKRFIKDVEFFSNVSIVYLNGVDISKYLENALLKHDGNVINASIIFEQPSTVNGNISTEFINGYPFSNIQEILSRGITAEKENTIHNLQNEIKSIIKRAVPYTERMPNEFMYIEKSKILQITIPNVIDADAVSSNQYVLLHILGEESHETCDLPVGCKCPIQHTMEITPYNSVSHFINKGQQKIYSFDDDNVVVHFMANTISTDNHCRTNRSITDGEVSTMTWNSVNPKNKTKSFNFYPEFITGYVSGVQFFTFNDKTYVVIGRYYDPVSDTHDLDCTVIRINEDKTTASEIQRIPTQGAWTIHLLHTAQGVTLIVGNIKPHSYKDSYTSLYRFNATSETFDLLRTVNSFGCTHAAGVVLGIESLIILSNKKYPTQVLRYSTFYDNYYDYQTFELDSPVAGISTFYIGDFGISDAYLCIVTEDEKYRIYSYHFINGWKLESTGRIEGVRNLIPFELNKELHLFAPSTNISTLLTVVKNGSS